MTKTIVIGNCLNNTRGILRSLYQKGIKPVLILESPNFQALRYSKYISACHIAKSPEEVVDILLHYYGKESEKPVVFCCSDPSICEIDSNYSRLKNQFVVFNAGRDGRINELMDKDATFPIAEKHGFKIIKSWKIKADNELPSDIPFPCLVKGNNSTHSTKMDMYVCNNREELKDAIHPGVEYLIQEYVQKEYELDIIGLSVDKGSKVIIPAVVRKIRDEIHRQSVYIRLDDIEDYPDLKQVDIPGFIKELGYEGMFSIEVIFTKGRYHFLEINLRTDGCNWLYAAGGVNYPYLWYLYGIGKLNEADIYGIHPKTPLYLMDADDVKNLLEKKVSLRQWWKDFKRTEAFFNPCLKDPLCFMYEMMIHGRQAVKKLVRTLFRINWI